MSGREVIDQVEEKVLAGQDITREEAEGLAKLSGADLPYLLAAAGRIRDQRAEPKVHLCAIVNAKSGRCSEDCKFCAQSVHNRTATTVYDLLDAEAIMARARVMEAEGARRFSLVTSGRGVSRADFAKILVIYGRLARETNLHLCASLGIITPEQARGLRDAGVTMYHHNLEAAESYFPNICSTHSYQERVATIKACQAVGLAVCSGGIISMGESLSQRLEMAFALRGLGVQSVPLNILNPIKGTAFEGQLMLPPLEILQTIAIYRFILPAVRLRFAGGRENGLGSLESMGYFAGINAALVGSYLTTSGRTVAEDIQMILDMGLEIEGWGEKRGGPPGDVLRRPG